MYRIYVIPKWIQLKYYSLSGILMRVDISNCLAVFRNVSLCSGKLVM